MAVSRRTQKCDNPDGGRWTQTTQRGRIRIFLMDKDGLY